MLSSSVGNKLFKGWHNHWSICLACIHVLPLYCLLTGPFFAYTPIAGVSLCTWCQRKGFGFLPFFMILPPAACFTAFLEELAVEKTQFPSTAFREFNALKALEQKPQFCNLLFEMQELLNMEVIMKHCEWTEPGTIMVSCWEKKIIARWQLCCYCFIHFWFHSSVSRKIRQKPPNKTFKGIFPQLPIQLYWYWKI